MIGGVLRLGRPGSSSVKRSGACGAGKAPQKATHAATAEDGTKVVMTPGQILLPAAGKANDTLRMRNGGVRRGSIADAPAEPPNCPQAPQGLPPALTVLKRSETEPALTALARSQNLLSFPQQSLPLSAVTQSPRSQALSAVTRSQGQSQTPTRSQDLVESSACWGTSRNSPRTERPQSGKPMKLAQVEMSYPGGPWELPPPPQPRPASSSGSSAPSSKQPETVDPAPKRTTRRKRTAMLPAEEELFPPPTPEDPRSSAKKRSMYLMESLYNMRRVGWNKAKSVDRVAESLSDADDELDKIYEELAKNEEDRRSSQENLMLQVLRETRDTEASLGQMEEELNQLSEEMPKCGGTRHATNVLAGRAMTIVKRKRELLKMLEDRMKAFAEAQEGAAEIAQKIKEDTHYHPPEALSGMEKTAKSVVHRGALNPADASKSDFRVFSQTFGLPKNHQVFKEMELLAAKAVTWWAETALKEAKGGTEPRVLQRLLAVSHGMMPSDEDAEGSDELHETRKILADNLAEATLRMAEAVWEKDEKAARESNKAEPESARTAADFINNEIRSAMKMGAQASDHRMQEAKEIATQLLNEEKDRVARRVYEYARVQKEKDEMSALHARDDMKVGPASWAADSIERKILEAVELGVKEIHPKLLEARSLARKLRDEDVGRRRNATRSSVARKSTTRNSVSQSRLYRNLRNLDVAKLGPLAETQAQ